MEKLCDFKGKEASSEKEELLVEFREWQRTVTDDELALCLKAFGWSVDTAKKILKSQKCIEKEWKSEPSEDTTTFRFTDPETGLYYETAYLPMYFHNCRLRQDNEYTKDILDKECIHRDSPQKLFFLVSKKCEEEVPRIMNSLKEWILKEYEKEPEIVFGAYKDSIIIMCTNIIVANYKQKKDFIGRFSKTLSLTQQYAIMPYLLSEIDVYETLPSVTNKEYETNFIVDLMEDGYNLTTEADLVSQIVKFLPTAEGIHATRNGVINIIINNSFNTNINNNHHHVEGISQYRAFIEHIQKDKPAWYRPGEWLPKSILVEKYNERNGTDISLQTLMRNFRKENLMNEISKEEKRTRLVPKGERVRLFLAK